MTKKISEEARKYLRSIARRGGKKRAASLNEFERSQLATNAANARWTKENHRIAEDTAQVVKRVIDRLEEIRQREPAAVIRYTGPFPPEIVTGPTMFEQGDVILSPEGLAEWLQIPLSTVRDLCRARSQKRDRYPLPFFKLGKRVRFTKRQVLEWLSKLEQARKS
ncbi:MAG: helix-turn-helix domain-containing protein [Acidobacteriia bacterium]|nr:helix-turn-helix domain-containing protein [Terriglobia bacterium]